MTGLAEYISREFGIECIPGRKHLCPKCGHKTFSMKHDGTVAKCFYPSCGWFLTLGSIEKRPSLHRLLSELLREWHKTLIIPGDLHQQAAMKYLLDERGISQSIIESASIGLVPEGPGVGDVLGGLLEELRSASKKGPGKPKKGAFDPHKYADWLEKQGKDLIEKAAKARGWIAFFYQDAKGKYCSIHFRKPWTKNFITFKLKGIGLFGMDIFVPIESLTMSELNDYGLVVEGEFDCLIVQSVIADAGRDPALVVATGGTSLLDIDTLKLAIPKPVICQDNDEAGDKFVERISNAMNCEVCSPPTGYGDIDEYLQNLRNRPNEAYKALISRIKSREPRFQPLKSVKQHINQIRRGTIPGSSSEGDGKMKSYEIDQKVAETIIDEMSVRGAFFQEGDLGYYLSHETGQLMEIVPGNILLSSLLNEYGINATEKIYKFVVEEMYQHAIKHGELSIIHRFSYLKYARKNQSVLYIAAENCRIIRITRDSVDDVENGTDGVLFLSSDECAPRDIPFEAGQDSSLIESVILERTLFKEGKLNKEQARFLLKCWIMGSLMRDIIPHKPILALIGPKASGKSTTLQMIGKTLFGMGWDVKPVGNKEQDFDTLVTNQVLVGLDNIDAKINWLNDKIAVAATGGIIPRRVLYTTNRLIGYPIISWIAVTSRTPQFRREDVADRLLILETESVHDLEDVDFHGNLDTIVDIESNRKGIWAELIHLCQSILGVIDEIEICTIVVKGARMQDFARFTAIVGKALGCELMAHEIWAKHKSIQREFAIENDIFTEILYIWVKENPGNEVSSAQLCEELRRVAEREGVEWPYRGGRSIGQKIKNLKPELKEYFVIEERKGPTNTALYKFYLLESVKPDPDS